MGLEGVFWPSEQQELLLRVAVGRADEALAAWEELRPFDVQGVEVGSFPVLPLVARSLDEAGVEAPELPRLKGTERITWYRNQLHVRRLPEALRRATRPVVLGGLATAAAYYPSLALRPVLQTELLVEAGSGRALEEGEVVLVRRETLPTILFPGAENAFRARAEERKIGAVTARVLDPTDELLLVVAQGARSLAPPSLQWLLDAHQILASGRVEAEALAKLAAGARLVGQVRDTLAYLERLSGPVHGSAIGLLESVPTTSRERLAHRLTGTPIGTAGMLPRALGDFLRTTAGDPLPKAVLRLPRHLQEAWGLERPWELPRAALKKAAARARPPRRG